MIVALWTPSSSPPAKISYPISTQEGGRQWQTPVSTSTTTTLSLKKGT